MRRTWMAPLLVLALAAPALAQTGDFTPPPMVPSGPPPTPPNEPGATTPPPTGTPPPPGAVPPSNYLPNAPASGYQYSPYGQPTQPIKAPPPEIGLMVSESLFGMLTAAGVSVLPYVLLFGYTIDPKQASQNVLPEPIASVLLILLFSSVPLAVAQTQVGIANGSRFYASEQWPASLSGLAAQAAVLGLFYLTGWLQPALASEGGTPGSNNVPLLLIGTAVVVPLVQMAVINLTKDPKFKPSALTVGKGGSLTVGIPVPTPLLAQTRQGTAVGLNVSLLSGRF